MPSHTAFVSASLDYGDRQVMDFFRQILFENDIQPITVGIDIPETNDREAAKRAISEIAKVDCVVAILTPRYMTVEGEKKPSEWLSEEPMTGCAYDKPVYIFHEKGLIPKGGSATLARWMEEFERNDLEGQRGFLSKRCSGIRDELAEKKNKELWGLIGKVLLGIGVAGVGILASYAIANASEKQ